MKLDKYIITVLAALPEKALSVTFEVSLSPYGEVVFDGANRVTFYIGLSERRK